MDAKVIIFPSLKNVPEASWKKLSTKKIYFGHQSVGYNIIDGIKDVMKENPQIKLNIVESSDMSDFNAPVFAHSRVGKNMDPKSKVDEFARFVEKGIGNRADIAFLKFCYVDAGPSSDVKKIFRDYRIALSSLKKKYPRTLFIHITMPLTSVQTGPKAWIKKLMGRPLRGYDDNIKRNEFNKLLRIEYGEKDPIFDLARIESTFPNGRYSSFNKNGVLYYSMFPEYTDDGGHLNGKGRKVVAEQLLIFLAKFGED